MSKSLTVGVVAILGAVVACGDSAKPAPKANFVFPQANNLDAGSDGGAFPGLDASPGGGGFTPWDSGNPFGNHDAGHADSSVGADGSVDSDAATDGGAGADAGKADGGDGGERDASTDAGSDTDAAADAGGQDSDGGLSCGTAGLVAGNDCAGVVTCQDNNGSGKPVSACDVGGAQHCCIETNILATAKNSCRSSACSNGLVEATCDGPEDCSGNTGICCMNSGATSCKSSCQAQNRLCHEDADCSGTGKKCVKGQSSFAGDGYLWWGFCDG